MTLGKFEGREVVGSTLSLLGKAEGNDEKLDIGHELVLVVRTRVEGINFKSRKKGVVREHGLKILDILTPEDDEAKDLLERIHIERKRKEDERTGQGDLLDGDQEQVPPGTDPDDPGDEPPENDDDDDDNVDYAEWSIADLRAEAKGRGLSAAGSKKDLIARIEADNAGPAPSPANGGELEPT